MKRTLTILFCLCILGGYAKDSTAVYKNKIILVVSAPSFFKSVYHTIGYSRLFSVSAKNDLTLYGGIGFLPDNDFDYYFGKFFYAYTSRAQINQKTSHVNFSLGFEYTYLNEHNSQSRNEHHFFAKLGFDYSLFNNRFYIAHYINFGRLHTFDPSNHDPRHTMGNIGLDLGFNF